MTENRDIMSFFTRTLYSNSIELADGSHTLIQGISTTTTPTFLY